MARIEAYTLPRGWSVVDDETTLPAGWSVVGDEQPALRNEDIPAVVAARRAAGTAPRADPRDVEAQRRVNDRNLGISPTPEPTPETNRALNRIGAGHEQVGDRPMVYDRMNQPQERRETLDNAAAQPEDVRNTMAFIANARSRLGPQEFPWLYRIDRPGSSELRGQAHPAQLTEQEIGDIVMRSQDEIAGMSPADATRYLFGNRDQRPARNAETASLGSTERPPKFQADPLNADLENPVTGIEPQRDRADWYDSGPARPLTKEQRAAIHDARVIRRTMREERQEREGTGYYDDPRNALVDSAIATVQQTAGGVGQAIAENSPTAASIIESITGLQPGEFGRRSRLQSAAGNVRMEVANPHYETGSIPYHIYNTAVAVEQLAGAVTVGAATRNPQAVATGVMGMQIFAQRYDESRRAGRTPHEALVDGGMYAIMEAIPERMALGHVMVDGGRFGMQTVGRLARGSAAEGLQEDLTESLQILYDAGVLNEQMSWGDVKRRLIDSGIAGAGAGGAVTGGHMLATAGGEGRSAIREMRDAEFATPADTIARARLNPQTPGAVDPNHRPGIRETAAATAPNVTPEDIASPLQTDLIAEGKSAIDDVLAGAQADQILDQNISGRAGDKVEVTIGDQTRTGTIKDAFQEDDPETGTHHGAVIEWDGGGQTRERFADLAESGARITRRERPGARLEGANAREVVRQHIRRAESSGNDNADNPRSSADGRYQFIDETFRRLYQRIYGRDPGEHPDRALKNNTEVQERLMDALLDENEQALRRNHLEVTAGNLYLSHVLGSGGAAAALRNPNASAEATLGAAVISGNPQFRGMTNAQVAQWAAQRMGGHIAPGDMASAEATPADEINPDFSWIDRPVDQTGAPESTPEALPTVAAAVEGDRGPAIGEPSSTGLGEIGAGIAGGISGGLHDMLFDRFQRGLTTENGAPSTPLQVLARIRDNGGTVTRENLPAIVNAVARAPDAGPERQTALQGVVNSYSQPTGDGTRTAPIEVTTAEHVEQAAAPTPQITIERANAVIRNASEADVARVDAALPENVRAIPRSDGAYVAPKKYEQTIRTALIGDGTRSAPVTISTAEDIRHAETQTNTEPSEAQIEAGNYQKSHVRLHGIDITIENPKGSERSGVDPNGEPWTVTLPSAYGYAKRTTATDGENVDVYVGDHPQTNMAFVIDQVDADTGKHDEPKVMMGFPSWRAALEAYRGAFSDGRADERIGAVTGMSVEGLREWLKTDQTGPVGTLGSDVSGVRPAENVAAAPVSAPPASETEMGGVGQPSPAISAPAASEATITAEKNVIAIRNANEQTLDAIRAALPARTRPMLRSDGAFTLPAKYEGVVRQVLAPVPQATAVEDRPLAASGLNSYRYKGRYGWVMIGAKDIPEALHEAERSLTSGEKADVRNLQAWDGETYRDAPLEAPPIAEESVTAKDERAPQASEKKAAVDQPEERGAEAESPPKDEASLEEPAEQPKGKAPEPTSADTSPDETRPADVSAKSEKADTTQPESQSPVEAAKAALQNALDVLNGKTAEAPVAEAAPVETKISPAPQFKVKPPKRLWRGITEGYQESGAEGAGTAHLGRGLYSAFDKSFARKYAVRRDADGNLVSNGRVTEISPEEAFPRNPLVLRGAGGAGNLLMDWVFRNSSFKRASEFYKTYPDPGAFVREHGYDGVIAGDEVVRYFENEPEKPLYQRRLNEGDDPVFYSALERAVEASTTARASAEQWAATLSKAAGIKRDELEWSGVFDWLDAQTGPVSRDDLLRVIRDGGIKVEEVVLGGPPNGQDILSNPDAFEAEVQRRIHGDESLRTDAEEAIYEEFDPSRTTKFGNWSSDPNNPTYRELLITLPIAQGGNPERAPKTHWDQEAVVAHARFMEKTDAEGKRVLFVDEVQSDWHQSGRDKGYETELSAEEKKRRDDKLTDASAKVEEIELRVANVLDDTLDRARERNPNLAGLVDDAVSDVQEDLIASALYRRQRAQNSLFIAFGGEEGRALMAERDAAYLARNEAQQAASLAREGFVPDAPFKSSWPALVMKRIIRYASDNGFDKIAWTTGAEQGERYNLSHRTGIIAIAPNSAILIDREGRITRKDAGEQGKYIVRFENLNAQDTLRSHLDTTFASEGGINMTADQVLETFGRDLGGRMLARADAAPRTGPRNFSEFRGEDTQIGAEGMKAFYDRNLVNIANDLIKRHGGKVGPVGVYMRDSRSAHSFEALRSMAELTSANFTRAEAANDQEKMEFWAGKKREATEELEAQLAWIEGHPGFDITPPLADAARSGFPLFQAAQSKPVTEAEATQIAERLQHELDRLGISDRIALKVANELLTEGQGSYFRRVIKVSLDMAIDPMATLNHESIHAMKALGLFNASEWTSLHKAALADAGIMDFLRQGKDYASLPIETQREEAVAEYFARWRTQRLQAKGFAAKAFQRLSDFLHALARAIAWVKGQVRARDVLRDIERGRIGRRETGAGVFAEDRPNTLFQKVPQSRLKRNAFPDNGIETTYLTERTGGPEIPRGMNIGDYDLFARKVMLDELSGADPETLPFGFSEETLAAAQVKIDALVNKVEGVREAVRKYHFAQMLAEAAAGADPSAFTGASQREPIEGEPPRAANIRMDKLESTQDIRTALEMSANRFDQFKDSRRGVVSHEETQALADDLDMTVEQLTSRRRGQAFNAHELLAARQLLVASANDLVEHARKAEGGSDAELLAFRKAWVRHVAIQEQVSGMTAEAGRALNQFKLIAKAGGDLNARMMREILETEGGRGDVEKVAKSILGFINDPAKMNRYTRQAYSPTWRDKLFELWINGLLSGPATHAVNALSNAITAITQIPEYALASGIGKVRSISRPETDRILRSEVGARAMGMIQGAKEGARLAAEALRTGEGSDVLSKLEARTQRAISGKKGEIIRIPSRLLIVGDELFKGMARRMELEAQAARIATMEGLTGDDFRDRAAALVADPTPEMVEKAMDYARYSTFQRPLGEVGQAVTHVINKIRGMRLIVPFIRTPANIFKFALARTPAAPILKEVREDLKAGGPARDLAVARIIIGSALGATVMLLAAAGIVTGGDPDDDNTRRLLYATGWRPYSIKFGDTYYSYARLDPIATVIGLAADLTMTHENMNNGEREAAYSNLFMAVLNQLKNKTFLSGIGNLIEAIEDPGRFGPSFIGRLAGTVVPTGVAQLNSAYVDPVQRDTRQPSSGSIASNIPIIGSSIDRSLATIESRIPGLSSNLTPRRDIWGQIITREGGVGPDIASPIATTHDWNDHLSEALLRAGVHLNVPSRRVGGAELSPQQYDQYQILAGQYLRADVEELVNSDDWADMSGEERIDEFDRVKNAARRDARQELGLSDQ